MLEQLLQSMTPDIALFIIILILLGFIIGIWFSSTLIGHKRFFKDVFNVYFTIGLILFFLMWVSSPENLEAVGVLATFVVAILTFRTVSEMKETRISQTRPHIIVDIIIRKGRPIFDLIIKNIGNGIGYNFSSEWNPELIDSKGQNYSDMNMAKNINYLPPDKEITTLFDSTISYYQKKPQLPRSYVVKVSYEDEYSNSYEDEFTIDLSIYENISYLSEKSLNNVVKVLEQIRDRLG